MIALAIAQAVAFSVTTADTGSAIGWGEIAATLITTIGVIVAAYYGRQARAEAKGAHEQAAQVNAAVNNVPKGAPPLVQRVGTIETHLQVVDRRLDGQGRWLHDSLTVIAEHLGAELPNRSHYDPEGPR